MFLLQNGGRGRDFSGRHGRAFEREEWHGVQRGSGHANEVASDSAIDHALLGEAGELCVHHEHADAGRKDHHVLAGFVQVAVQVMLVVHADAAVDGFQEVALGGRGGEASEARDRVRRAPLQVQVVLVELALQKLQQLVAVARVQHFAIHNHHVVVLEGTLRGRRG